MQLNKKGFTLIELLAVIVVLGIILAIAIPRVVDTIENSKKGSFETSVKSYIKSAEQYISVEAIKGNTVTSGSVANLDMKNKSGWVGYWKVDSNGKVYFSVITNNDYVAYNSTSDSVNSQKLSEPFKILANNEDGITINNNIISGTYTSTSKNIIIPESVTGISNYNVFIHKNIENLIIPSTIENLINSAFESNNLTTIIIPNGIHSIGSNTFASNKLSYVELPNGLQTIGAGSFYDNQLTNIIIPSTVQTIEIGSFSKNSNLTSIINKSNGNYTWAWILFAENGDEAICTKNVGE